MSLPVESGVKAAFDVTPSDANTLADDLGADYAVTKGIFVGVAGDVEVMMANGSGGSAVVFGLLAGFHPLNVTQILDSNTTATGIKALY